MSQNSEYDIAAYGKSSNDLLIESWQRGVFKEFFFTNIKIKLQKKKNIKRLYIAKMKSRNKYENK